MRYRLAENFMMMLSADMKQALQGRGHQLGGAGVLKSGDGVHGHIR